MRYSLMEPHPHPEHVTGEATWAPHYLAPILFLSFVPSFMSNRMMSELSHKVDAHTHVWYFPSHNFMHFVIGHPLGTWSMIVLRILLGGGWIPTKKTGWNQTIKNRKSTMVRYPVRENCDSKHLWDHDTHTNIYISKHVRRFMKYDNN